MKRRGAAALAVLLAMLLGGCKTEKPQKEESMPATEEITAVKLTAGDEKEALYLEDNGSFLGKGYRFCEYNHSMVYKLPLKTDAGEYTLTLDIANQYKVELSADGEDWSLVAQEKNRLNLAVSRGVANRTTVEAGVADVLGKVPPTLYVRISENFPDDPWGGLLYSLTCAVKE